MDPWFMTVHEPKEGRAQIFVTDIGQGTIVRIDLSRNRYDQPTTYTQIGSTYFTPFPFSDGGAQQIVYDAKEDALYVAAPYEQGIYRIPHAGKRKTDAFKGILIYSNTSNLLYPTALAETREGHLIAGDVLPGGDHQAGQVRLTEPRSCGRLRGAPRSGGLRHDRSTAQAGAGRSR